MEELLTYDPTQRHFAIYILRTPLILTPDDEIVFVMLQRSAIDHANIGRFRVSTTDQPGDVISVKEPLPLESLAVLNLDGPTQIDNSLRSRLRDQYLADHPAYQQAEAELNSAKQQLSEIKSMAGPLNVMVMAEQKEPRTTHILERGVWDQRGNSVTSGLPAAILPWPQSRSKSRLDLANWLISPDNPLTARVIVNQLWQLCFGVGLVRTPEDFGLQGEPPTHPELLDWLAVELVEHNWDLKHILRLIVTSQTYQQSSQISPELLELDPENRLLARGARFRLPSWMLHDAALRSSGLMNPSLGGPPTKPYQPEGAWEEQSMGKFQYRPSQGTAQFRRTLYTFWRRSAVPTFLFDTAQRRVCEVTSRLTNTPLQALTLLNDLTMLEASRELARSVMRREMDSTTRLNTICQSILSRDATPAESEVLSKKLEQARAYYRASPDQAQQFLNFGQVEHRDVSSNEEVAAYTVVASLIYNLDEALTHE
ncbi:DUF1553 domain-containing protein [Planctomicrobium sp. SH661]|uniref:DUF1553 domain-containing protein n=1 Tax=Planctomicrobium sp. SH661 TaxID=3448124 RepID=UPI003F5B20CD